MEQGKINIEAESSNLNTQQAIPNFQQTPQQNPLQVKEKKPKSRIFIYIILGFIFLLIVGAAIFSFWAFSQKEGEKPSPTLMSSPSPIVISNPSPKPEAQEKENHWLNESTSAETDPKAGAIFANLFLKGEAEKSVEGFYSDPKAGIIPNLIYALIESIELTYIGANYMYPDSASIFYYNLNAPSISDLDSINSWNISSRLVLI